MIDYKGLCSAFFDNVRTAREKWIGWSEKDTWMDPSWSYEDMTERLYRQASPRIYQLIHETLFPLREKEGVALEFWTIGIKYTYDFGNAFHLVNGFERTTLAQRSTKISTPDDVRRSLAGRVPSGYISVVMAVPRPPFFRVWQRDIYYDAPRSADGAVIFTPQHARDEAKIVPPDESMTEFFRQLSQGDGGEATAAPSPAAPAPAAEAPATPAPAGEPGKV